MYTHVCKDFASYHFCSWTTNSIKAFGTDSKLALAATFANAQHVSILKVGNVEQKLQELHIPSPIKVEITKDVMGNPSQLQHGLVDAESSE